MIVFVNGHFVPEEQAAISVFDRGFLYGDGLFETMRIANGKPFRWTQHADRLQRGANFLGIPMPYSAEDFWRIAGEIIAKNQMREALLRLTLSRGVGVRGYSPKGADRPTTVMSLHPIPADAGGQGGAGKGSAMPQWNLIASSLRLAANQPLAQFKTCNKLPQILARAEADAVGVDEALLLSTDGFVVEASASNLFWIEQKAVCTAPLISGILPGVTRAVILEICRSLKLDARERNVTLDQLKKMQGVFLSLSSWGVVEAVTLDGHTLATSPLVHNIGAAYQELVRAESR